MKYQENGFTLIELLIVIAIIGILAAVLIDNLLSAQKKTYDTAAMACAKSIQTTEAIAQIDEKTYWPIGSGEKKINRALDGIDQACKDNNMYITDRSSRNWVSDYTFDVWDGRGSKVVTVTPTMVEKNVPGATPFSTTGNNLP